MDDCQFVQLRLDIPVCGSAANGPHLILTLRADELLNSTLKGPYALPVLRDNPKEHALCVVRRSQALRHFYRLSSLTWLRLLGTTLSFMLLVVNPRRKS